MMVRVGSSLWCPGTLRVTIGAPEENDAFLTALAAVAGTGQLIGDTPKP